ncbi:cartilage intermediate layer protein 1-like isoform X1 [Hypanus sabinus]|uniref:cartilage intermediate layer protein 1-like isoform X1 n=2 Tax=Hypanus sabinus TaxID=79690 RepID=UPI0028C4B681|nr:cartilage intermediate layer protein 1-like isoform X1 [Hypanus sabinus]XP_059809071.1 cartilage intermediate layer protein 1-like isoform X1 [Hypanus sabinus]
MDVYWAATLFVIGIICDSSRGHWQWTQWFNIDHPGGRGDLEQLDAIQRHYPDKLCPSPVGVQARTTQGVPAALTGETFHLSSQRGFWCLNKEQLPEKHCSNYAVRFQCPRGPETAVALGSWSTWGVCGAGCEQTRTRTRPGPLLEGRMCPGAPCAGCGLTCSMGRVNAACSRCMCEDYTLLGSVRLQDGAPASGATVHLRGDTDSLLTTCDHNGKFRIPGLCPDGSTAVEIRKPRYNIAVVVLDKGTNKVSIISVKLKRSVKPFIRSQPQSKIRHEGQSVTFCCNAVCDPPANKYSWYHNGSLLDERTAGHGSVLVLHSLQPQHAGQYSCRASNPAGFIKSQPATLTVTALMAPSCNPVPESYFIQLPADCYQNQSHSFLYDAGRCPAARCAGDQGPEGECRDAARFCCGAVQLEDRSIPCSGYTLPIRVVKKCGCQRCIDIKATVRGRAVAADNGEPMRLGQIFMGGRKVGMTGYKGTFSMAVPADVDRLVLTFVDRSQKFVNTTKVLAFNRNGGSVFHQVRLLRKKPATTLDCSVSNAISMGGSEKREPIAELEIPANSFYKQNGEVYRGLVQASITFLDARDTSLASAAPSDLDFVNEEGDVLPLRTYGMFSLDFTDEAALNNLNAGQVRVFLDTAQVQIPEHLELMKLWSLNPDTGFWEEEGDFTFVQSRRGRREERTFLVGNMEIRERRLFNLDVPESRRCYVKVRTFRGDRFTTGDQLRGAVVSLINLEPLPGFSSNPRAWGRFDSVVSGPNGACVPAFCDERQPHAYSAYVTATLRGEELEAISHSLTSSIGVQQPLLQKFQYRRSDHEDPRAKKTAFRINVAKPNPNAAEEANGPVYPYQKLRECEEAPFSAAHFRFYRVEGDRYEYNTVAFNEDDPMSWTEDYLAWWPRPLEFRACYIKVKLTGTQDITVRSRNLGGTHPRTVGQLYGLRDVRSTRDVKQPGVSAVCLEFKCSGTLYDQERVDRTLVKIIPQGHCRLESINNMFREYLVNELPLAVNNDTSEFTMLAPLDPLGHNYGIYTVTDQDAATAKEIALGRCFAGSSDTVSRVMKSNAGVALTFNCADRPVGQQDAFQSLQNFPGQPRAHNQRVGRGKRGRLFRTLRRYMQVPRA